MLDLPCQNCQNQRRLMKWMLFNFQNYSLGVILELYGINAVFYFSSTIFKGVGVPSDISNICVGLVNISGQKLLLIWSFLGMAVALALQVIAGGENLTDNMKMYFSVGAWRDAVVCLKFFFRCWSSPWPPPVEDISKPDKSQGYGILHGCTLVGKLLRRVTVSATVGDAGPQILYSIFGSLSVWSR